MRGHEQNRDLVSHVEAGDPNQRRARQIERRPRLALCRLVGGDQRCSLGQSGEIDDGDRKFGVRRDELEHFPFDRRKRRAQRCVASQKNVPGLLEISRIDEPFQAPANGDVEPGVAGVKLFLEPEALLRLRTRKERRGVRAGNLGADAGFRMI